VRLLLAVDAPSTDQFARWITRSDHSRVKQPANVRAATSRYVSSGKKTIFRRSDPTGPRPRIKLAETARVHRVLCSADDRSNSPRERMPTGGEGPAKGRRP
jgi:hypothetical protein